MNPFLDYLKEVFVEKLPQDAFLKSFREKAWVQCSLPTKAEEAFQYIPLRELYQNTYAKTITFLDEDLVKASIYPECEASVLVFVNGHYYPSLSHVPERVVVVPLQEAMGPYGQFLRNRWAKQQAEEKDSFALLNHALHATGAFIYVPPKLKIERPLQILNLCTGPAFPRLHFFLGAESEIHLIQKGVSASDTPWWSSGLIDFAIEEKGKVTYVDYSDLPSDCWFFQAIRSTLKREASFHSLSCHKGSKVERLDYRMSLLGENASAHLQGLSLLKEGRQSHTHVLMEHLAPQCHSMQTFKKVLYDHSQSSFQGQIYVSQKGQKTSAYQINNNLILGSGAIANSKPNLKIFADDVKASHGATMGQLDEEALFYLRTRGLSLEEAKKALVKGFCQEHIDQIPYASVKECLFR